MDDMPRLIPGGLHVDARGIVSFVNDFDFKGVERFYMIRGHQPGEPRGWVGHKRDRKWFAAVQGTVLVAVVKPDNWTLPTGSAPVERFVLSAAKPAVLAVPSGYATAQMMLSEDAILMVFSSGTIQQAREDDFRFPIGTWKVSDAVRPVAP